MLVEELRADDSVAMVTFGDDARVDPAADARGRDRSHPRGDRRAPGPRAPPTSRPAFGSGYGLARETLTENGIDRIVLASDGVANVGLTDADGILAGIREDAAAGIELVSVGVGMGNYNDALLEQLADQGDGFYAYVNTIDEARRLFVDDLTGTLQTVALDAKAQVEFEPDAVAAYRLLGYENRAIDDHDFTDDTVDAGAIGAGHAVTALYAVRLRDDAGDLDRLATLRLRWTDPDGAGSDELSRVVRRSDLADRFHDTAATFRLDAIVAATAEVLRDSPYAERLDLHHITRVADEEADDLPPTDQVHQLLDLLDDLTALEE